jgi:hypothetical protein
MNKRDLQKRQLDEQEWHLALTVPTSEWLMPGGRERTTPAKQHRGKA